MVVDDNRVLTMIDQVLSALLAAWTITVVATTLLVAAVTVASLWDPAACFLALRDALTADPL
jgi:hypothetical protein